MLVASPKLAPLATKLPIATGTSASPACTGL